MFYAPKYNFIFQFLFLTGTLCLLLLFPTLTVSYAKSGLSIWYQNMVPSLLPMMILTGCMIKLNITGVFSLFLHPLISRIYHLSKNGTYAFVVGFLCGFPMGAKVTGELYLNQKLSKKEASALLPICNNIGPVFLITYGFKAVNVKNIYIALLLFYAVPLVYGRLLFRKKNFHNSQKKCHMTFSFAQALDDAIAESSGSILSLGGYLMFFSILSLIPIHLLHLPQKISAFFVCFLEITGGLSYASYLPPWITCALLQFGGVCCLFQTIKYISKAGLNLKNYILHKTIMSVITLIFFFVLDFFFSVF